MRVPPIRPFRLAVTLGLAVALAACTSVGGPPSPGPGVPDLPDTPPSGEQADPDGPFVREGVFGRLGEGMPARLEITAVEREPDRTALRAVFTPTGAEARAITPFGVNGLADTTLSGFQLLDPVGQRVYHPLVTGDGQLGSRPHPTLSYRPGVAYELVAYFPRLPAEVTRTTVLTPGSTGEYTGIPVTDVASPAPVPTAEVDVSARPGPGERVALPVVREPRGQARDAVGELYGVVERVVQARREEQGVEQVALRSDVLFGFDEATLDGNARTVLADVIAETRRRADPQRPPIAVVGHTDGIGDDAYNQGLSERRAAAVRDVLTAELGPEHTIRSAGLGSSRPVAREGGADDAEARARNRRVEIAYRYRQETPPPATTTPETGAERVRAADPGEPAPFRPHSTEPVASRRITTEAVGPVSPAAEWTLHVHPFYRDGAYLVASFDLVHESGGAPFIGMGLLGVSTTRAGFAEFSAVDRATGTRYRDVRFDTGDDFRRVGPIVWPHVVAPGGTNRGYLYLPAPPPGVTALTFHAGGFGVVDGVPIR